MQVRKMKQEEVHRVGDKRQDKRDQMRSTRDQEKGASKVGNQECDTLEAKWKKTKCLSKKGVIQDIKCWSTQITSEKTGHYNNLQRPRVIGEEQVCWCGGEKRLAEVGLGRMESDWR